MTNLAQRAAALAFTTLATALLLIASVGPAVGPVAPAVAQGGRVVA